ncbi:MAG: glutamine-hydrolyzing carbamoyl-phosphate synthase small subunit [Elusimicrobiota bacterium]
MGEKNDKKAILALEDGTVFYGSSFGYEGEAVGELVFNTSMTGYQEILTDPSYKGQIVMFTYPLIGNYGVTGEDVESNAVHAEAMVVREYIDNYSNWRAEMSLADYLKKNKIVGIKGVDTRALTRLTRIQGAMKCIVSTTEFDEKKLVERAKNSPGLIGRDLVREVTCGKSYIWNEKKDSRGLIVVMDFGVKYNILRMLDNLGYTVKVVPAYTKAEEILRYNPNGIMLTNGPGDPAALTSIIDEIKKLLDKKPIFGICLGHQLLGLAMGGKTYKLKFGHRGGNHPVKNLDNQKVAITSQNHGFCVDMDSLKGQPVEITYMNLYDNTVEGLRHKNLPIFSVQYHPEAAPGPHDAGSLFLEFKEIIEKCKVIN